jgi:ribose 5-phosphate isomerase B
MRVAFGCDHAGALLRGAVTEVLRELGIELCDFGSFESSSTDYCLFAERVARAVVDGRADLGILVCGTGVGMSIAANKVPGIYAAHASDPYTARMAREHNGANVLTMGARVVGDGLAQDIVRAFLSAEPDPEGRHARRREQVRELERRAMQRGEAW